MKKNFDELNKTFNLEKPDDPQKITSIDVTSEVSEVVEVKSNEEKDYLKDRTKDYEYSRNRLYSIIERGMEAIDGMLEVAQETEGARPYEVVGQLIKSVTDANDKIMDLHKKMKDLDEEKKSSNPTSVNNTMFVGSTAELLKLIKQEKNNK
jgi:TRAP-type uncharacterized transport system substrate-binding protein